MPSIAASTIAAPGDLITGSQQITSVVADDSGNLVPIRSALPVTDVLDTVTAASLPNGVPVQTAWRFNPPTATGSRSSSAAATTTPAAALNAGGVPWDLLSITASEQVVKMPDNSLQALVSVAVTRATADPYYSSTQIWVSGYQSIATPQLVASGSNSPIEFYLQTTGETVTITAVALGATGLASSFSTAPTATLTLNGVTTAPPAPTISQTTTALSGGTGWQFAWNALNGLLQDVIAGYWVYVSSSNDPTTATRFQYFAQPTTNIGVLTFQELTSATHYYWVSAVNTSGLESTKTAAAGVHVTRSYYPTNATGTFTMPPYAYDMNETTCASGATSSPAPGPTEQTVTKTETWSSFQTFAGTAIGVALRILVSADMGVTSNGGSASSEGTITYSLDNGVTWLTLLDVGDNYGKQYLSLALPTTQNLANVQVQATSSSTQAANPDPDTTTSTRMTVNVFEIRVEVTQ